MDKILNPWLPGSGAGTGASLYNYALMAPLKKTDNVNVAGFSVA
jgi:hypothetical protein